MDLNDDQIESIVKLAGCNYTPEKIALFLGIPETEFLQEFADQESKVYYHFNRGLLIANAEMDMSLLDAAKKGNITAYQTHKKESFYQKIENSKKRIFIQNELKNIDRLQLLVNNGECTDMSPADELYYKQLDFIRALWDKMNNKNFIVNALIKSFNVKQWKALELFNDSLNFFNQDKKIKVDAWANIYADRLDVVASVLLEINDFDQYLKYTKEAAIMRGVGKEKPQEVPVGFYDQRPTFYSMRPKDVGLFEVNRNKLADFIDKLMDIPADELQRLHRDAKTGKFEGNFLDVPESDIEYLTDEK
jgi:hypothetical protein